MPCSQPVLSDRSWGGGCSEMSGGAYCLPSCPSARSHVPDSGTCDVAESATYGSPEVIHGVVVSGLFGMLLGPLKSW